MATVTWWYQTCLMTRNDQPWMSLVLRYISYCRDSKYAACVYWYRKESSSCNKGELLRKSYYCHRSNLFQCMFLYKTGLVLVEIFQPLFTFSQFQMWNQIPGRDLLSCHAWNSRHTHACTHKHQDTQPHITNSETTLKRNLGSVVLTNTLLRLQLNKPFSHTPFVSPSSVHS